MKARRLALTLLASIAAMSAAVAACGGNGSPKIKSFTASSSNVPLPGGPVTLTWNVKGDESLVLKPFPGAVSGTGITLELTESTEFTLVAKGNGRTDRKSLYVGVGDPFAVNGRVLRFGYSPASGQTVYAQGKSTLTDDAGNFVLEGIVAPYDLVILDPDNSETIIVYAGLTRIDPTIVTSYFTTPFGTSLSGTVSGVPFPTPTPPPASSTQIQLFSRDGYMNLVSPDPATGSYGISSNWAGGPDTSAKLTVLRSQLDVNGIANAFPGFARTTHSLEDGTPLVVNPVLAPVAALPISASLTTAVPMTTPQAHAIVDFGAPEVAPQSGVYLYALIDAMNLSGGAVSSASNFTRYVPDVGASYALSVSAQDPASGASMTAVKRNLAGGATGVQMFLPQPPRILLPVEDAVLTTATQFSMTRPEDETIFVYNFYLYANNDFYVYVISDRASMTAPDFPGLGLAFDDIEYGVFYGSSFGPFGTVDDLAGPGGLVPASDDSFNGFTNDSRTFSKGGISP